MRYLIKTCCALSALMAGTAYSNEFIEEEMICQMVNGTHLTLEERHFYDSDIPVKIRVIGIERDADAILSVGVGIVSERLRENSGLGATFKLNDNSRFAPLISTKYGYELTFPAGRGNWFFLKGAGNTVWLDRSKTERTQWTGFISFFEQGITAGHLECTVDPSSVFFCDGTC